MRAVFFLAVVAGWAAAAQAQIVTIGTAPQGSYTYSLGAAVAQSATNKAGLQTRVQPYGGTTSFMPLLNNGEIDFGIGSAVEATQAFAGDTAYQGRKAENLRMVAVMVPFVSVFFVKKDSPVRTNADLKGKTLPSGYGSQAILNLMHDALYANGGYTANDVKSYAVSNIVRAADDFAAGKLDAFFFAFGGGKVKEVDATVGGVRAVPLVNTPEAIAAMQRALPQTYAIEVKPAPHLTGVPEPGLFMAYDMYAMSSTKVPDETVYRIAKVMHESRDAMIASFPPLRDFDPKKMAKPLAPLSFHSGAEKFYREVGQWPPKG